MDSIAPKTDKAPAVAVHEISADEDKSNKAPSLQVPAASYSYFACVAPSPMTFARDAMAALSSCFASPLWASSCAYHADRHHHQQHIPHNPSAASRGPQALQGYRGTAAMTFPSEQTEKRYMHTPTHAAAGFLSTSTAAHMRPVQE